jgi:hypothetical protein
VSDDVFNRVQERMEKNKLTPAAAKAPERYLLTTKLFCGECGKMLAGESGTGTGGKVYRYYKCHSAKNKKGCHQKPVKKAWIEDYVVQQTMLIMMDGPLMERITDRLLALQGEENHDLKLLEQQLKDTEKGIENMLNAIQAGIITASTKQRLSELEDEKADLEQRILQERISHPALTREQVGVFLDKFRNMNKNDEEDRQRLIESFLNAVYIDDEKIVLVFNYKGGTKTVGLKDINNSSDLESERPPESS